MLFYGIILSGAFFYTVTRKCHGHTVGGLQGKQPDGNTSVSDHTAVKSPCCTTWSLPHTHTRARARCHLRSTVTRTCRTHAHIFVASCAHAAVQDSAHGCVRSRSHEQTESEHGNNHTANNHCRSRTRVTVHQHSEAGVLQC
jgi:hypothetical protein